MKIRRMARAAMLVGAVAVGAISAAVPAVPAWAHVEVSADNPQAGARDVTVTFNGEAESSSAGIVSERIVLPAEISPSDVRLDKAPPGWTLTPNPDGFTVGGAALRPKQDAVFSVVIAQLPADATELAFKTLESYSNGNVSRWIEVPQPGAAEPDNPAPVLKLKPAAAPPPTSAVPTLSSPAATTPVAATSPTDTAAAADTDGSGAGLWLAIIAIVLAAVVGGLLLARRRSGTPPSVT